ncbi:transposase [Streptomyces mirabilis]|uniref:IS110 family transposase n=1 Tax=Streptomyces mirabilis TaxID=68239 RepID=UPI00369F9866
MLAWLRSHGQVLVVGVEGTGSFGAELARCLRANQIAVIEVDQPDRRARRAAGKSDSVDAYAYAYAYAAATAVLSGRANGTPKDRDGTVEAIHALRAVRASAVRARTQTTNRIKSLIITAPAAVREALLSLTTTELIRRLAVSRPGTDLTALAAVKLALMRLAKRYQDLSEEIADAGVELRALITRTAPGLLALQAFGPECLQVRTSATEYRTSAWLGSCLRVGQALFRVVVPTPRCVIPILAHDELPADSGIMRAVAGEHRVPVDLGQLSCLGVYRDVMEAGTARVGDPITLQEAP